MTGPERAGSREPSDAWGPGKANGSRFGRPLKTFGRCDLRWNRPEEIGPSGGKRPQKKIVFWPFLRHGGHNPLVALQLRVSQDFVFQAPMSRCTIVPRMRILRAKESAAVVDPKSWQKMAVYDSGSARPRIISVGATSLEIGISIGRALPLRLNLCHAASSVINCHVELNLAFIGPFCLFISRGQIGALPLSLYDLQIHELSCIDSGERTLFIAIGMT